MQLCYVRYNNECSDEVTPVTSLHHFHRLRTQYYFQTVGGKREEREGERREIRVKGEGERGGRDKSEGREKEKGERGRESIFVC